MAVVAADLLANQDLTGILSLCEVFNLRTQTWKMIGGLNVQRCTANATVFNGRAYVFGGFNGSGRVKEIERYNEADDRWEFVQVCLKYHIEAAVLVMLSDSEVLFLGGKDHYSQVAYATVYNLERGSIEELPKMNSTHVLAKGGRFGKRIVCFGGSSNTGYEYFDLDTFEWNKISSFEFVDGSNFGRICYAQTP